MNVFVVIQNSRLHLSMVGEVARLGIQSPLVFCFFSSHLQCFYKIEIQSKQFYVLCCVGVWTRLLPQTKNWDPPLHALRTSLAVTETPNMRSLWLLRGLSILEMPGYLRCFL
jgi:hypothetical protein